MRFSFTLASLGLISSAVALTITAPTSSSTWDFNTPQTIKFTSNSTDPEYISIILRSEDGSFQTKLADNVKTADGEYTTQSNPSISNGDDYEIQIIDSAGTLALSQVFTVEKGATSDGTTSSSLSSTASTTSSSSSTTLSTTTTTTSSSSSSTSSETSSTPTSTSLIRSASSTPASSTPLSSSASPSASTSSTSSSSSSSRDTSSTASSNSTTTALLATGAASSLSGAPKGAVGLLGAAIALLNA
ncbi:GPI anchored serine-threonine rich family protein [Aspergillus ibericus CBS 121593]|uniref:Yeast cell wall synthesis Kre9/Knh1-like N-terminal domain-containing protein n=1 Tax=Aspergillus ibericus CBS 121593 TaxID=1448316 RepID=A0A395H723_9EURO|nr:hypothetical protein BO80DRAFT_462414 [Aspergillus ibericus CBS 121593]RAL03722.1 hypothetical protein BO80DRAFT_462414 [Aspergillus ibericus CBS 121593]